MIKRWNIKKTESLSSNRVFSVRQDTSTSPETGKDHEFFVIEPPDWINVVAITDTDEIVLIKQYRHGTQEVTIEIPGGMVDPGEEPLQAAKRELQEETGYVSNNWQYIGEVEPNPAIQSNRCHTFLARSVYKVAETSFDTTEYIETFTEPVSKIKSLVEEGSIKHALVVAALYWFFVQIR